MIVEPKITRDEFQGIVAGMRALRNVLSKA